MGKTKGENSKDLRRKKELTKEKKMKGKKQEKEGEKFANIWPFTAFFPQKRKITLNFPHFRVNLEKKVH